MRSPAPIDAIALGAWQAWPNAGTVDADPYSRARLARTGEIPLGSGEGLMLLAQTTIPAQPLAATCDYTIAGQTPPARLWTLVVENRDGQVFKERDGVAALGSDALLREDGRLVRDRALAHVRKAGNWISTGGAGRFRVVVRLYDTTARTGTALTTLAMPRITPGPLRMSAIGLARRAGMAATCGSAASLRSSSARCFLAGAIHICAILLVPVFAKADGWSRLAPFAGEDRFTEIAVAARRRRGLDPLFVTAPAGSISTKRPPALRSRRATASGRWPSTIRAALSSSA